MISTAAAVPVYVVCRLGNDSQLAVELLRQYVGSLRSEGVEGEGVVEGEVAKGEVMESEGVEGEGVVEGEVAKGEVMESEGVVEGEVAKGEVMESEGVEGEGVNVVIKDIAGGLSEWADTVDPSFPKY